MTTLLHQLHRPFALRAKPMMHSAIGAADQCGLGLDNGQRWQAADLAVLDTGPVAEQVQGNIDAEIENTRNAIDVGRLHRAELGAKPFAQFLHDMAPFQGAGRISPQSRHRPDRKCHIADTLASSRKFFAHGGNNAAAVVA